MDSTNTPHDQYLRYASALPHSCPIPAYVNWLEEQYQVLSHPHIHPTEEERAEMDGDEVAKLIAQRVYDAACLAERFEVEGKHGRLLGNGHHFAQKLYETTEEDVRLRWHPKV